MSTRALSVALPSEVIYVSGTVNDVAYTWTRMDDAWRATVERAADERYRVSLTAVNSLGTSASYDLTLYYGLQGLITDRTEADAARVRALADKGYDAWTAAELAWWRSDPKGGYDASDLNRVGSAVDYVAKRLRSCGIFVSVAPRMDWANGDKPNRAEMAYRRPAGGPAAAGRHAPGPRRHAGPQLGGGQRHREHPPGGG